MKTYQFIAFSVLLALIAAGVLYVANATRQERNFRDLIEPGEPVGIEPVPVK